MVLWEITLATAYVLGLKRTYRLAVKLQKRVLGTKYPRIRAFTEQRTKDVFRVALNVHTEIQRRDISVGRSLGNWVLRMLDRARPQANIRGAPPSSQRGARRPSQQPKIDSSKPKQVNAGRLGDLSSNTTLAREPIAARLRSRITNGLKLKTRSALGSLPALTSVALWWKPVRKQSTGLYQLPNTIFPSRSFGAQKFPPLRVLQSGTRQQGSVFREDIARLMHH